MKRVLCLFYYFPPSGGAGSLRCLATARHLLDHGWLATVIAPRGNRYHTPGEDLLNSIPPEIKVVRTACLVPACLLGRRRGAVSRSFAREVLDLPIIGIHGAA